VKERSGEEKRTGENEEDDDEKPKSNRNESLLLKMQGVRVGEIERKRDLNKGRGPSALALGKGKTADYEDDEDNGRKKAVAGSAGGGFKCPKCTWKNPTKPARCGMCGYTFPQDDAGSPSPAISRTQSQADPLKRAFTTSSNNTPRTTAQADPMIAATQPMSPKADVAHAAPVSASSRNATQKKNDEFSKMHIALDDDFWS